MAFARFRHVRDRLNVSIVEAARTGAKVSQCHVASLGSVPVQPSARDRVQFWAKLHPRLAKLDNRLDDKARMAILTAINARIPMPTAEDQEAAGNAGREANARLFSILRDKHTSLADVHRRGAEQEAEAAAAIDELEAAHASRPLTPAEMRRLMKAVGWTDADLRHARDLNALCELVNEDAVISMLSADSIKAGDRWRHRATRRLLAALTSAQ